MFFSLACDTCDADGSVFAGFLLMAFVIYPYSTTFTMSQFMARHSRNLYTKTGEH